MGDDTETADAAFPAVSHDDRRIDRAQLLAVVESSLFDRELEPVRFGRYILEDPIGEGGFGIVYQGEDPTLRRKVAIKLLRSRRRYDELGGPEALAREARMAAQLQHPNVVRVFDVGCMDSGGFGADVYIVMELLRGLPLGRWLRTERPEPETIVDLMVQVADGLAAAHRRGIVHCDVKPGNVLVTEDGQAKVVDFGLALHSEQRRSAQTIPTDDETGEVSAIVAGTPAYMAPEVHGGASLVPDSDQYSFAIMLAEALAGEYPFERGDPEQVVRAKARGLDAAWLRKHIPRGLIPVIERASSVAPGARFADMDEVRERLRRWLRPPRVLPWAAGAAVLLAGAGGAWAVVDEPPSCPLTVDAAAGLWADARVPLEEAWAHPQRPWGAQVKPRFEARIDAFVHRWGAAAQGVCEADPPERVTSQCLSQSLGRLESTLETVIGERGLEHADSLLSHLESGHGCLEPQTDSLRAPMPQDVTTFEAVTAIRDDLSSAHALFLAGRYDEGLQIAKGALEQATRVGFEPAHAEAVFEVGLLTAGQGRFEASVELIEQSYFSAQGSRYDALAAATSVRMVGMYAIRLSDENLARAWARRAEVAVQRLPDGHRLHAELALNDGVTETLAQQWTVARRTIARAAEGYIELGLEEEVQRCRIILGTIDVAQGEYERALERFESVIAFRTTSVGAQHPSTAYARSHAADALSRMGKLDRARAHQLASLASLELSLGRDHQHVASVVGNLAVVEMARGNWDAALVYLQRTHASFLEAFPADHPEIANALDNLASVYARQGDHAKALELDRGALEIRTARFPPNHPMIARSHAKNAEWLARLDRVTDARRDLELATDALEHWPTAPAILERVAVLDARVALGEQPVREFRAVLGSDGLDPIDRWDVTDTLARLLVADEPGEARRLAAMARDGFAAMGATPKAAAVDAWLRSNGI